MRLCSWRSRGHTFGARRKAATVSVAGTYAIARGDYAVDHAEMNTGGLGDEATSATGLVVDKAHARRSYRVRVEHDKVCGQPFAQQAAVKALELDHSAKVPGTDGQKMSKSYGNTLEIFADPKAQRKQIMRITTDSRPMEEPKEPETDHLYQLYSLLVDDGPRQEMAALYRRGGFGYGEVKKALADAAEAYFVPARQRREEIAADADRLQRVLASGAERARDKASQVLRRAQLACGLKR